MEGAKILARRRERGAIGNLQQNVICRTSLTGGVSFISGQHKVNYAAAQDSDVLYCGCVDGTKKGFVRDCEFRLKWRISQLCSVEKATILMETCSTRGGMS